MKKIILISLAVTSTMTLTMPPKFKYIPHEGEVRFTLDNIAPGKTFYMEVSQDASLSYWMTLRLKKEGEWRRFSAKIEKRHLDVDTSTANFPHGCEAIPEDIQKAMEEALAPAHRDKAKNILHLMGGWLKKIVKHIETEEIKRWRERRKGLGLSGAVPRLNTETGIIPLSRQGKQYGNEIEFTLGDTAPDELFSIFVTSAVILYQDPIRQTFVVSLLIRGEDGKPIRNAYGYYKMTTNPQKILQDIVEVIEQDYAHTYIPEEDRRIMGDLLQRMIDEVKRLEEEEKARAKEEEEEEEMIYVKGLGTFPLAKRPRLPQSPRRQ